MTWGYNDNGELVVPTVAELIAEVEAELRGTISPSLRLTPDSPEGQMSQTHLSKVTELWEAIQGANEAKTVRANGISFDDVAGLTGVLRLQPASSRVTCDVDLDAGTTRAAGEIRAYVVGNPDSIFANEAAVESTTAGVYPVVMVAESVGPISAPAGELTEIIGAPGGVNSITNAEDAEVGRNLEDTPAFRVRRRQTLNASGSNRLAAIVAAVRNVPAVVSATGLENDMQVPDTNGLPGNSFEVVALFPNNAANNRSVGSAIWGNKGAGIRSFGNDSVDIVDSEGWTQTVQFSRPTELETYLKITLNVDPLVYPASGDADVAEAVKKFTTGEMVVETRDGVEVSGTLGVAVDLILSLLHVPIFTVAGIRSVTGVFAGPAASPTDEDDITVSAREAITDGAGTPGIPVSRIEVVST